MFQELLISRETTNPKWLYDFWSSTHTDVINETSTRNCFKSVLMFLAYIWHFLKRKPTYNKAEFLTEKTLTTHMQPTTLFPIFSESSSVFILDIVWFFLTIRNSSDFSKRLPFKKALNENQKNRFFEVENLIMLQAYWYVLHTLRPKDNL